MSKSAMTTLKEHFSQLNDPRAQHSIEHWLIDIVHRYLLKILSPASVPTSKL